MITELDDKIKKRIVIIGDDILEPVFEFLRYCLHGSFHLNEFASAGAQAGSNANRQDSCSHKRKRIIERMAIGLTNRKKRRFPISKVKEALQSISAVDIDIQLDILTTHVIVERPTRKTACLIRDLSNDADSYLTQHCSFNIQEIRSLKRKISELIDN